MRILTIGAAVALAVAIGAGGEAQAAGCLSGAAVGGLAGHMAHHGVLGAVGGCAVGHHMAKKQEREATAAQNSAVAPPQSVNNTAR